MDVRSAEIIGKLLAEVDASKGRFPYGLRDAKDRIEGFAAEQSNDQENDFFIGTKITMIKAYRDALGAIAERKLDEFSTYGMMNILQDLTLDQIGRDGLLVFLKACVKRQPSIMTGRLIG